MSLAGPQPTSERQRKWDLHYMVGVFWITYWASNLYVAFGALLPFMDYYVVTAILLMYIALARPTSLIQIAGKPMMWLWALTAIIPAIMYLDSQYGSYSVGTFKTRIVYLSAIGGMAVILLDNRRESLLRSAAKLSLAITVTLNVIDLLVGLPISRAEGRAAGLWRDPNITAAALCSMLLIAVDPRKPSRRDMFLVALSLFAILITFSRSGILFGTALGLVYLFGPKGPGSLPMSTRLNISFAAILLLAVGSVILLSVSDIQVGGAFWRIESLLSFDTSDASAQGRREAFLFALERSLEFFWTGRGLGASQYYGVYSHNAYLEILYDYGIFGLLIYLFFISQGFFQLLRYGWRRAAIPGLLSINLLYYGMFAHTLPTSAGMALPMVIFMLKVFIDPPQPRASRRSAQAGTTNMPGLLQPDRVP